MPGLVNRKDSKAVANRANRAGASRLTSNDSSDSLDIIRTFMRYYVSGQSQTTTSIGGMTLEDRLTAQQAAAILGISVSAVHRLCTRGTLAFSWFAGRRVIQRSALDSLKSSPIYRKRTRKPTLAELVEQGKIHLGVDSL